MNRRIIIIVISFMLLSPCLRAQCFDPGSSFKGGEEIIYDAVYNWGIIWINAGTARFRVEETTYRGEPVYYFDSYGSSLKSYDWFFKVRDHFQAYLDKDRFVPLWFKRDTYEGGYSVNNVYSFDYTDSLIYTKTDNSKEEYKEDTLTLKSCTYDVLSLIYYTRSINFQGYSEGDKIPVRAIIDNEIYDLYIRYLGKEEIVARDGKIYDCIKFSALLVEGTIFKGGEDLTVWVTNDKNKIPVLVEAKILIGSVKAELQSVKGLKKPLKYRIKD